LKEGFGNGTPLFMGVLSGNLEAGSFTGDPEGYVKEGWGDGHPSIGVPLGNLEWDPFTRDFERWVWVGSGNGASLAMGALLREPGRGAPLLGTLKYMYR
jgi:hypothetical protein